ACSPPTAVAVPAATITPTTVQLTFTPSASGVTDYTATVTPAVTGSPFTVTASPFTITGLTPGTTYTVTLTTNCSGGGGSSTATLPVTFTTAFSCVTPTYAAVPYTQTFENTWITNCALRDVPSLNWKLTAGNDPDASFRRNDDGAAGNWTSNLYGYTPAGSNAGGTTSSFSARYHSGNVSPVTEFALFDLYANV
ncbi:fibronectin type III domain-containing protein, partial [Hymenobacter negativus]